MDTPRQHTLTVGLAPGDHQRPLASIDVTPEDDAPVSLAAGGLTATSGNLYLYVDGIEYGSLLIEWIEGKPSIHLGQYDDQTEDWEPRNPIRRPAGGTA